MEDQEPVAADEATEAGYFGEAVDPTPNENYTVEGVASGAPTPETDAEAAEAAGASRALVEALSQEQPTEEAPAEEAPAE